VIASDHDKLGVRDLRLSENGIKDGQYAMDVGQHCDFSHHG
jgi:hypothetical protein